MFDAKQMTRGEANAYEKGLADGKYGFTYVNPSWTDKELLAWNEGFQSAKRKKKSCLTHTSTTS